MPSSSPTSPFQFTLLATSGAARRGRIVTSHGSIETPVFMPVGTKATVKALTVGDLKGLGAQIILCNTFHMEMRPGSPLVETLGGLHTLMKWDRPILTDSGGFQVFSLPALRQVTEEGAAFRSPIDGTLYQFTPETALAMQRRLG
ncbi:MAG: tRNA-guanine transglycosylase, partial [Planctomycetes bacterium]|nr:tRNA-guanine transglycosylase [Planctomycetota bacterium]